MLLSKRFSGILNKDSKEADVLPFEHIGARNIRFTGGSDGLSAEFVKGTVLVNNGDLPNGTNECNGAFFDSVKQRIIWFNWNQYSNHGIYIYSINTGIVTQIFRCGVNSATDVLGLSLDYPVHSASIVYRTTGDGDLLYWTNGYGRPMCLNLDTVATESPFTANMLYAAKNAPLAPPTLEYADNSAVNVNNLRNKLFRSCYRWVYKNGEKSTFSPISKVPLPIDGYDINTQNDPTKNNNIVITLTSGGNDYKAIEVAGQFNVNNTWGDFFLIDSISRDDYNISPNSTYDYSFYNDGSYSTIAPEETDLYFSWLPDKANTLELLNGNVLIYGGITDGYNKIAREDIDVTVTSGLADGQSTISPSISYTAPYNYLVNFYIGSDILTGTVYNVQFNYDYRLSGLDPITSGTVNVSYTTLITDTRNDIVAALVSAINTAVFPDYVTATNTGGGYFSVEVAAMPYVIRDIGGVVATASGTPSISADSAWKWGYTGRLGLVYFDERGKTNGVISFVSDSSIDDNDFSFTTPDFTVVSTTPQIPFVSASINHTPPTWATSYQWVRANMLPTSFLYWVTNDYQTDTDYLYICIQNLTYQKQKSTGFVPSYEFEKGDRIKVIAAYTGGNFVPYNVQLDMEILGVVPRTMTSPAETGSFIKVAKPSTLPSAAYQAAMFVEIYTPIKKSNETSTLFFEWGEKYNIYESGGVRYHRGQVADQTASQAASFKWFDGDVYYHGRRFYQNVNSTTTETEFFMDANYSDYYESAVNSNGRAWVIDENAKEEYNPVLVRWGGGYQSGTNINKLNIFRPADYDEVDRVKGDIRRFKVRDRILRVFQDRGVGQYGIYARFIQNNEGVSDLVTTNEIITSNNIQYYQGVAGLGGYPTNLCSSPIADYFTDIVTGRGNRLGYDGLTDLGVLYKGQYYFPQLVTPYNKTITRTNGSKAKVMAFFDSFDGDFHTILQGGTGNGVTTTNQHFSFNESRNGYVCDGYDYAPDFALSANDVIYSWKDGFFYKHTNESQYCYFYGVHYNADITLVFNENLAQKKSWNAISEVATGVWACPLIYTNVMSYGSQRQETNLVDAEFKVVESMPSTVIKRDIHSRGGKIGGSFMKGNWAAIKFQKISPSNLITLTEILVRVSDSPVNRG
jgi:hypothetical protein